MADNDQTPEAGAADEQQAPQQQFAVQKFYVKDCSFESPMGAEVFTKQWKPQINVDMNTKSDKIEEGNYEVVLTFTITAKLDNNPAMLVEVQQAGIFLVKGLEGEALRQALAIIAPNLLFPYVREAVDGLALKGGFPALSLQPINFEALYRAAAQQAAEQKEDAAH